MIFVITTVNLPKVGYWWIIECPVEITSACLPSIFTLVKRGVQHGPRALFNNTMTHTTKSTQTNRSWTGLTSRERTKPSYLGADSNEELNYLRNGGYSAKAFNNTVLEEPENDIETGASAIHVRKDIDVSRIDTGYK